ncbi:MAG TPA: ATP-binding protein [Methylomirabilota bacterium]|nr:ATP-binding protein [Methylomirabilota bacterium]
MTFALSINWLFLIVTAVANLCVGAYVFRRAPKAPLNRAFALLSLSTALWSAALAVGYHVAPPHTNSNTTTVVIRCAFAAGSLFAIAFILFVQRFTQPPPRASRVARFVLVPVGMAFFALSFSPWIVISARPHESGLQVAYGPLHPLFAAYALVGLSATLYMLIEKHRYSEGHERLQVRYVLLAFVLSGALIVATNIALPLILKTSAYGRYGPLFSLLLLGIVGHAILRHRLLDIRIVIHRGVIYLAALALSGATVAVLLAFLNMFLPDHHDFSAREITLVFALAVCLHPLKNLVQRLFDRYLYRDPYDYARTLREASQALTASIDLPALLQRVASVLDSALRPEGLAIYLYDGDDDTFYKSWSSAIRDFAPALSRTSAVASAAASGQLVFRDEIPTLARQGLQSELDLLQNTEVIVPLVEQDELIGFLVLGAKRSGDPYFSNDADLLTTLANQAAVAVRNAQTHARVVQVNEEMQKVLETIESGVVAVGPRGRITLFNRAAELLTGTSAQTVRGQAPEHLPGPLGTALSATAVDGEPRSQIEFSLPDAAGQLVPLMCSTSPLRGPDGAPLGAVAVLADMSRLKELEQEKRRAERLASIEAIASGLIHEIRNPLVGIKTYAQLLPSRGASEEFREMFSRTAGREITRIDDLLSRFRTMSRASQHPMEMVDPVAPLRDALETLHAELEDRKIKLRRVGELTGRRVLGNVSQLQQLFLNLCLNAIQAMDPSGELTVRVADLSEGGGSTLLVEVADTGRGIPEHLLASIFDPFVTTKPHGTGLGLAICRSIADAHHARLGARNNVGRPGCTFTVEFPVPTGRAVRVAP